MAREALAVIIRLAGQVPSRLRPLSSNVRPRSYQQASAPARSDFRAWRFRVQRVSGLGPGERRYVRRSSVTCRSLSHAAGLSFSVRVESSYRSLVMRRVAANSADSANMRLVSRVERAARPLAGGEPSVALGRESHSPRPRQAPGFLAPSHCTSAGPSRENPSPSSRSSAWRARPNPSLEATATGLALGPRTGQCHHPSRGPSANPASAPQLKR